MRASARRRAEADVADVEDADPDDLDLVNSGIQMPRALKVRLDEITKAKHFKSRNKLIISVLKSYVSDYDRERRKK